MEAHQRPFYLGWKRKTLTLNVLRTGEPIPFLDRGTATLPNTPDWFGRWRPVANQTNDYLIDRDAQRTVSYSGIEGVFPQDSAMVESMGAIADRTLEHLAPSDRMIIVTRRRLLDAARALRDNGTIPPLVDNPACEVSRPPSLFGGRISKTNTRAGRARSDETIPVAWNRVDGAPASLVRSASTG